jgi:malonyl CoA-acyl carrier protein transacylase
MKTFLFPGQGSQAKGMGGRPLFDRYRELVGVADRILGYSITELCLDDPRRELARTQFTQPAIFVVNALSALDRLEQHGRPDFVAGHSLGEFNALLAADCFDFETGLRLVQRRAELMGQAAEGGMAAVLNAPADTIRAVLDDNGLDQVDIANFNTPKQIVISGARHQIAEAQKHFRPPAQYIPLNTSGAFHSRFMAPARAQFEAFMQGFSFRDPTIPVVSNVGAVPYAPGEVASNLARQITGSVRWAESVGHVLDAAAQAGAEMAFIECGHGDVLSKMLPAIRAGHAASGGSVSRAVAAAAAAAPAVAPAAARGPGARERVETWNRQHPVGTRVRSALMPAETLATRTPAVVLFQHRAAVYLEGYNGYFDLEELAPA